MPTSLKVAISQQQPNYTKGAILLYLNSNNGAAKTHIVVEDEDDINVYIKMFNPHNVNLYTSETEEHTRGCIYLEQIVDDILKQKPNAYVIGIRDADYLRYIHANYTPPKSIFLTDHRDLEMMLLSSPSVVQSLIDWNVKFENALTDSLELAKYKGLLRICNDINRLGCNFKKHFKQTDIWDEHNHKLRSDWKEIMKHTFLSNCNTHCDNTMLTSIIDDARFEVATYYHICQGHDVVRYLSMFMIKNEYSKQAIQSNITKAFDKDFFYQTNLWKEIEKWALTNGVNLV